MHAHKLLLKFCVPETVIVKLMANYVLLKDNVT